MVVDWLAFPLLVLAVSVGCGLLVERLGGWRLPGALVPGVGLALAIVVASLTTESRTLAPRTVWFLVGLAVLGYLVSVPRLRAMRIDLWPVVLALLVFLVFAAPVLAYGHPDFLGYGVDGDAAFHFLFARDLIARGHAPVDVLPYQNSATALLEGSYLKTAYPFGGDVVIGALRSLVGEDIPWVYDPFIAVALAFGALALDELLRDAVDSRPLRALAAFIAAQAGLAYSFFLISSIKELLTTWLVTLTVVLAARLLRRPPSARGLLPLIVVAAAELYDLAVPGVPWVGLPLIVFAVLSLIRVRGRLLRPRPSAVLALGATLAVGVLLILPVLRSAATSLSVTTSVLSSASGGTAIAGNLGRPLSSWQIMGIWPNGDYRLPITTDVGLVDVLLWIAVISAVLGALWMLRRRAWGPLVLLLSNGIVAWILLERSGPYAASKVMAILSVTAVLAAMLGAVALYEFVRPWLGWALAAVIALAVLWTNQQNFQHAPLAPAPRFEALGQIGERFRDQGPTYYDMWDFEWPAYFLRTNGPYLPHLYGDPTTPPGSALRSLPQLQYPWDLGDITLAFQQQYRLIVVGRSPLLTRPPADYRLVFQNRFYDVFRRVGHPVVTRHVIVSDLADAQVYRPGRTSCAEIRSLGALARRRHERLAVSPVPLVSSTEAIQSVHPLHWAAYPNVDSPIPDGLTLNSEPGELTSTIRVPRAGRYTVWLQGELTQPVSVTIADHHVGTVRDQIGPGTIFSDLGTVRLPAGRQPLVVRRSGASLLAPSLRADALGAVALTRTGTPTEVRTVSPDRASTLCGQRLQWLELVR